MGNYQAVLFDFDGVIGEKPWRIISWRGNTPFLLGTYK
jgi:hypothetical protein